MERPLPKTFRENNYDRTKDNHTLLSPQKSCRWRTHHLADLLRLPHRLLQGQAGIEMILVGESQGMTMLAKKIIKEAKALEKASAFAILLEIVPNHICKLITERAENPACGLGRGGCHHHRLSRNDLLSAAGGWGIGFP
jgi:ketopantoate hydroxymethyltransferase